MKGGTHARSEKEETYCESYEEDREAHDAQVDWARASQRHCPAALAADGSSTFVAGLPDATSIVSASQDLDAPLGAVGGEAEG